ncbi:MAG TPA: ATP-binding cassette domain-containing protein [Gemmatimonadaceae bacterium]|nr:ATP-binding cassette domain-containing protein [Gemmatimonadaceae bacterium]
MAEAEPLLALEAVSKRFGSVEALAGTSLVVRPGTVHALLGENGAGKTTLMRIAYGLARADSGIMRWRGERASFSSPRDALAAGIAMVQQHFSLVPALTVAENVALGGRGFYSAGGARRRVRELSAATGLEAEPDAVAGTLGVGAQQRVEILKALARGVKLLILDEPTATLAPADAAALLAWARRFASDGHAVVLITHKLRDALDVADDVTVLRGGRVVLSAGAAAETERTLAIAMLGAGEAGTAGGSLTTRPALPAPSGPRGGADVVADLRGVAVTARRGTPGLASVTFAARRGEIVGIAAVEGNGERELIRILAGRERPDAGALRLPPKIGYIPQDRHSDAIADDLSLAENIALAGAGARSGWIDWRSMGARTAALMTRFDVRASGVSAPARTLSGGNQQRLVLARELDGEPSLVVADQPTRGLDLRATADVHERLRQARAAGAAVVLHSADLDEVLALADRVVVVAQGRVEDVGTDREAVGRAMLGAGA